MEFDNNTPIYIQVMDMIKKQIASGELKSGDKLPSVRELAVSLKVNPNTIQRTYQELDRDEITKTQRGLGRYVTEDNEYIQCLKEEMCREVMQHFIYEIKELGLTKEEVLKVIAQDWRMFDE